MLNIIFISLTVLLLLLTFTKVYEIYHLIKEKKEEEYNLNNGVVTLEDIDSLSNEEFTGWSKGLLISMGYEDVEFVENKFILGSYLTAFKNGVEYTIFCSHNLSINVIARVISAVLALNNKNSLLITSNRVNENILNYLNSIPIDFQLDIIDGDRLVKILSNIRKKELTFIEDFS